MDNNNEKMNNGNLSDVELNNVSGGVPLPTDMISKAYEKKKREMEEAKKPEFVVDEVPPVFISVPKQD